MQRLLKRPALAPALLWGCVVGFLLAVAAHASYVFLGSNFHTVLPGRVYRSAQPSTTQLEGMVRAYGIRTVINLRGIDAEPWYCEECRTTQRLQVVQEDVGLYAGRLPLAAEIRPLVEVLDRCEYPVLIHCRRGGDRAGLASAIVLLLQTDATLDQARGQLGLRYGHLRYGNLACLDEFFDLYAEWLQVQHLEHSRANFRRWIVHEYWPGGCRCFLEPLLVKLEVR